MKSLGNVLNRKCSQTRVFSDTWDNTSKAGKKPFNININRIDREFRHDPAAAYNDIKAKKILYRY
jgi:hypothetical protein